MALQISTSTRTQVTFTVSDPDHPDRPTFTDALYYPQGQVPPNATVRAEGLARYQAWRQTIDNTPRPSRAERLRALREGRDAATAQVAALDAEVAAEEASIEP